MRIHSLTTTVALGSSVILAVLVACGDDSQSTFPGGNNNADGGDASSSTPSFTGDEDFNGPWTDFPEAPIVDKESGTPDNAAALFAAGGAETGDGNSPCLLEPEVGAMVPKNWVRPRFKWAEAGGSNIFEIRIHSANEIHDLVVYTSSPDTWTMPQDMWAGFASHSAGKDITIAVRGGKLDAGAVSNITKGSSGPWSIAPVEAPGSIVYWYIQGDAKGYLKGFKVGEESARDALKAEQVQQETGTQCIGCHISSPDGKYAIFASQNFGGGNNYGFGIGSIEPNTAGQTPTFLTPQGKSAMESKIHGVVTVSKALWQDGKHVIVGSQGGKIRWVNLDGNDGSIPTFGDVALNGDARGGPNSPNLSHDGTKMLYVSADGNVDGRPSGGGNDLWMVPYNDGAGGDAAPITGAATSDFNEYHASFSPDDKLIAYTRTPNDTEPYASKPSEVFVVASGGGEAQRLAANDAPACSQRTSPGIENSWPKWAPALGAPAVVDGKTYYWIVFSSTRADPNWNTGDRGALIRQLYMAPVVVDADGKVQPYKATYMWSQPEKERNHTPAWDVFEISGSVN